MSQSSHYGAARVRRGAVQFLVGKVVSAALTFAGFALAARLLGLSNYAHYATLIAAFEVALALCTAGMDWAGARYLPEYRVHASASDLLQFLRRVGGFQVRLHLLVATVVVVVVLTGRPVGSLGGAAAVCLVALLLVVEGLGRVLRDQFLAVLMAQGWAQAATVARGAVFTGLLALVIARVPDDRLVAVLIAELVAAACAIAIGGFGLQLVLSRHQPDVDVSARAAWVSPSWSQVRAVARDAMINTWLVLPAGGAALTLVARSFAGADAAAAFGFVRGLVDQIRRFLPSELFLSLVRSTVVARYTTSRDAQALSWQLALVVIVSLLTLCPLLALMLGQPVAVLRLAGGPQFISAGLVLAVWSVSLWLFSMRRVAEVMAYTVDLSRACLAGGAVLATAPLWMAAVLLLGGSLPLALGASLLADAGFSLMVWRRLVVAGFRPPAPVGNLVRLVGLQVLAALAVMATAAAGVQPPHGTPWLAFVAVLVTAGLIPVIQPLHGRPRQLLMQLLPRLRFPC